MLYLVSTPIGNMEDINYRAVSIPTTAGFILCEDTRRTGILLQKYDVKNKLISFNDMNKEKKTPSVVEMLKIQDGALVTDAGTPGISDPGYYLVRECIKQDVQVSPVPGATSLISALVCSGMATDRFAFYGFLPKKKHRRSTLLEIKESKTTSVFFESPHRIKKCLEEMSEIMPERNIVVARELTKKFEEFARGKPAELMAMEFKGEIVVVVQSGIKQSRHEL